MSECGTLHNNHYNLVRCRRFLHVAVYAELFVVCGFPITFCFIGLFYLHKFFCAKDKTHQVELKCYEKKIAEDNEAVLVKY